MVEYISIYGPAILQYIELKRSLGYKYELEYAFRNMDMFLFEEGCQTIGFTRALCEKYGQKRKNETDTTC